jgi:ribose transport system substrate-binding protein
MTNRRTTRTLLAVSLVFAATALGAHAASATTVPGTEPPGTDAAATGSTEAGASQQVARTSGDLCTYEQYAGDGVEQVDLASATIGFAQSEREANPFRIAETQSIRDEAEARGIDLIVTNAESDLNKEISDIQGMVDQGVDALIISPLNSEGLDPALDYAKENGVPIMTIDRLLTTKEACEDYIGWIGSDFVEQGRRAADAMVRETGGEGRLAVLLGAPGVNVTATTGSWSASRSSIRTSKSSPSRPPTTSGRWARPSPSS